MKHDELLCADRRAFRTWLEQNHASSPGVWLVLGKEGGPKTVTAGEALEEALCFGWIDGQLKSLGTGKYLKKFTPRRKGSVWSARNRKLAETLMAAGRMTAAGEAAVGAAQKAGMWGRPRPEPISAAQIGVLAEALSGNPEVLANFLNMSPSVRRTYTGFYLSAKGEDTRKKRLERIIERVRENKKPM